MVSPACEQCGSAEGSLAHLFRLCIVSGLQSEWLSLAYSKDIQPNHDLAIFGFSAVADRNGKYKFS